MSRSVSYFSETDLDIHFKKKIANECQYPFHISVKQISTFVSQKKNTKRILTNKQGSNHSNQIPKHSYD